MFARFLLTDMIRAQAKASGAFAISVILLVAALPALAQQPAAPTAPYGYGGPWGWHLPFAIISLLCVLLALIGLAAIFVWLVRWANSGLSVLWPRLASFPWRWRPRPRRTRHSR